MADPLKATFPLYVVAMPGDREGDYIDFARMKRGDGRQCLPLLSSLAMAKLYFESRPQMRGYVATPVSAETLLGVIDALSAREPMLVAVCLDAVFPAAGVPVECAQLRDFRAHLIQTIESATK